MAKTAPTERYIAKVTSKGQLTVPKKVREALGIGPGDDVAFEVGPEGVTVTPDRGAGKFKDWNGRWQQGEGLTPEEIAARIHEMRGHDELAPWP